MLFDQARTVRCPNCDASNRRPKCGACHEELSDPRAIQLAWTLYERRKHVGIGIAATAGVALLAVLLWSPWDSATRLECREQAARTARTNAAMGILLDSCNIKFPK